MPDLSANRLSKFLTKKLNHASNTSLSAAVVDCIALLTATLSHAAGVPRNRRGDIWWLLMEQHKLHRRKGQRPLDELAVQYKDLLKELTTYQHAILIDLGTYQHAILIDLGTYQHTVLIDLGTYQHTVLIDLGTYQHTVLIDLGTYQHAILIDLGTYQHAILIDVFHTRNGVKYICI